MQVIPVSGVFSRPAESVSPAVLEPLRLKNPATVRSGEAPVGKVKGLDKDVVSILPFAVSVARAEVNLASVAQWL